MSTDNIGLAFGMSVLCGLPSLLGGAIVWYPGLGREVNHGVLAGALALTGGVMLCVSFAETFVKSKETFLAAGFSHGHAMLSAALSFFGGVALISMMEVVVHELEAARSCHGLVHRLRSRIAGCGRTICCRLESRKSPMNSRQLGATATASTGIELTSSAEGGTLIAGPAHKIERRKSTEALLGAADAKTMVSAFDGSHVASTTALNSTTIWSESDDEDTASARPASIVVPVTPSDAPLAGATSSTPEPGATPAPDERTELEHLGVMAAITLGFNNIPEGIATFVSCLAAPDVGVVVTLATSLQSALEGAVIAVPTFYATGSRWRAFAYAALSGLAPTLGGAIALGAVEGDPEPRTFAIIFGLVSGALVWITCRELLPNAFKHDPEGRITPYCLAAGMGVVMASLAVTAYNESPPLAECAQSAAGKR